MRFPHILLKEQKHIINIHIWLTVEFIVVTDTFSGRPRIGLGYVLTVTNFLGPIPSSWNAATEN